MAFLIRFEIGCVSPLVCRNAFEETAIAYVERNSTGCFMTV